MIMYASRFRTIQQRVANSVDKNLKKFIESLETPKQVRISPNTK